MSAGGWFIIAIAVFAVLGIIGSKVSSKKDDSDKK